MNAIVCARRAAALLAILASPTRLDGQTISGHAVIAAPRSSVQLDGGTDQARGVWTGVELGVRAGRFAVFGSGTRGSLDAAPERDVGELTAVGRYGLREWLHVELRYTARAFSSAVGYQRWDMAGIGASLSPELGAPAARAFVGVTYLPFVQVTEMERPNLALRSEVGLSLAPGWSPVTLALGYRIERFRFSEAATRTEQFDVLTLQVGTKLGRQSGRWVLGGAER